MRAVASITHRVSRGSKGDHDSRPGDSALGQTIGLRLAATVGSAGSQIVWKGRFATDPSFGNVGAEQLERDAVRCAFLIIAASRQVLQDTASSWGVALTHWEWLAVAAEKWDCRAFGLSSVASPFTFDVDVLRLWDDSLSAICRPSTRPVQYQPGVVVATA